ncbi:unnamed protein product [marine sediment metagenome]|uniref:Uncharacterized protein n=1 Tax=marine sediment metagenome TaxID=412755 RepID=X1SMI0_9ZZZZ
MTVAETIKHLSDLRADNVDELTVEQCHAIGIALVIMVSLEPSQVTMIDKLIAMTVAPDN